MKTFLAILFLLICFTTTAKAQDYNTNDTLENVFAAAIKYYEKYHYSQKKLDSEFMVGAIENFATSLDSDKRFLHQYDIDFFKNNILAGEDHILVAQELYALYKSRVENHITSFPFDELPTYYKQYEGKTFDSNAKWEKDLKSLNERQIRFYTFRFALYKTFGFEHPQEIILAENQKLKWLITRFTKAKVVQLLLDSVTKNYGRYTYFDLPKELMIGSEVTYADLGMTYVYKSNGVLIKDLPKGKAAEQLSSLSKADKILAIQLQEGGLWHSAANFGKYNFETYLKGIPDSHIGLRVEKRSGELLELSLKRKLSEEFEIKTVQQEELPSRVSLKRIVDIKRNRYIPLIRIDSFLHPTRSIAKDLAEVLKEMEKEGAENILRSKGLVLDLRGNSGGSVNEARKVAYLLTGKHPFIQTLSFVDNNQDSTMRLERKLISTLDFHTNIYDDMPLTVLVDENCASACEMLAHYLKESNRALVIGSLTTYGKGIMQMVGALKISLIGGLELKGRLSLTTEKYYGLNGEGLQAKGLRSDISLASHLDVIENKGMIANDKYIKNDSLTSVPRGLRPDFKMRDLQMIVSLQRKSIQRWIHSPFSNLIALAQEFSSQPLIRPQTISVEDQKNHINKIGQRIYEMQNKNKEVRKQMTYRYVFNGKENDLALQELLAIASDYEEELSF